MNQRWARSQVSKLIMKLLTANNRGSGPTPCSLGFWHLKAGKCAHQSGIFYFQTWLIWGKNGNSFYYWPKFFKICLMCFTDSQAFFPSLCSLMLLNLLTDLCQLLIHSKDFVLFSGTGYTRLDRVLEEGSQHFWAWTINQNWGQMLPYTNHEAGITAPQYGWKAWEFRRLGQHFTNCGPPGSWVKITWDPVKCRSLGPQNHLIRIPGGGLWNMNFNKSRWFSILRFYWVSNLPQVILLEGRRDSIPTEVCGLPVSIFAVSELPPSSNILTFC